MVITVMDRPNLVKVKDFITNHESLVHASRLRQFKHPKDMSEKIESLVAADLDEVMLKNYRAYWYGQESEKMEISNSLPWV